MLRLHLADEPLPEREGLRVGVVDPEYAHTLVDPEADDALHLLPERPPVLRVEIDWIDVRVLLRRVLGVADGAVGQASEPLRMLADIRMVGRALEGKVEGDLDVEAAGLSDETAEVLDAAEGWMHGLVAAFLRADGPGG